MNATPVSVLCCPCITFVVVFTTLVLYSSLTTSQKWHQGLLREISRSVWVLMPIVIFGKLSRHFFLTFAPSMPLWPAPPSCPLWPFPPFECTVKLPSMLSQYISTKSNNNEKKHMDLYQSQNTNPFYRKTPFKCLVIWESPWNPHLYLYALLISTLYLSCLFRNV